MFPQLLIFAAFLLLLVPAPRARAAEPPPGPMSITEACADPTDCRLFEAGRVAGVRVGLAGGFAPDLRAVALAESNLQEIHAFSWNVIWPMRDRWDFRAADAHYAFNEENGLFQAAFHFAWEQLFLDDLPAWVEEITDPLELRTVLRERARKIFARYPGLDRINVVNEPLQTLGGGIEANHFYRVLGPDYIVELFQIVREEAPAHVELVLNENFVEYIPGKAEALVALVKDLVGKGAPIDSVGFQTHLMLTDSGFLSYGEPDFRSMRKAMKQVAALGLTVWISELDNPVNPARPDRLAYQAGNYRRAVEACLSVPACTDILVWGVRDEASYWFPLPYTDPAPLVFDAGLRPKAAYFAIREALLAGRPFHPVAGHRLWLRDSARPALRSLAVLAKAGIVAPEAGGPADPTREGGVLELSDGPASVRHDLPAARWRLLPGVAGYEYLDSQGADGPVRRVVIQHGRRLEIVARGAGLGLGIDADAMAIDVALSTGLGSHCLRFPREVWSRVGGLLMARHAKAPASCPAPTRIGE